MDDGLGFDGKEQEMASPALVGGFGLESMKERAKALGGKLLVETEPGSGTKITAILPLGRGG
jgi:signal transduction histidine kinase